MGTRESHVFQLQSVFSGNNQNNEDSGEGKTSSLMSAEEKAVGTVALKVYKAYWLAIGGCLAFSILLFVVLMQGR